MGDVREPLSFGRQLKFYRLRTHAPSLSRSETYLTQLQFGIELGNVLRASQFTENMVSNWESGVTIIKPRERKLLCGIIRTLKIFSGLSSLKQANDLLSLGFYSPLSLTERVEIAPEWEKNKNTKSRLSPTNKQLSTEKSDKFHSCFISYSSKDELFAKKLHQELRDSGIRCWFAPEDMKIGSPLRKTISEQIHLQDKLIIILSDNSIKSQWVSDEVEKAYEEEKRNGVLKLFPIRLDNSVFSSQDDWAETIRLQRHIGDFSKWKETDEFNIALKRLTDDLKISTQDIGFSTNKTEIKEL